jgi:hypothetical protein
MQQVRELLDPKRDAVLRFNLTISTARSAPKVMRKAQIVNPKLRMLLKPRTFWPVVAFAPARTRN